MPEPRWLSDHIVKTIHSEQIDEDGGQHGIRDQGLLESALARPKNIYAYEKADIHRLAAAYAYGIAKNHPFIDGNKRVALVACRTFLETNGFLFKAPFDDRYEIFMRLASGDLEEKELSEWLIAHSEKM